MDKQSPSAAGKDGIDLLYIGGTGRSGSTLLDLILGNLDEYCSLGEIRKFWDYMPVAETIHCGCRKLLADCEFWGAVNRELEKSFTAGELERGKALNRTVNRSYLSPLVAAGPQKQNAIIYRGKVEEFAHLNQELYAAIHKIVGEKIIVDSSKVPTHLGLIARSPELSIKLIHLVRDSRAVSFSWMKRRQTSQTFNRYLLPPEPKSHQVSQLATTIIWVLENLFLERYKGQVDSHLLKYEKFATNPKLELLEALKALGLPTTSLEKSSLDLVEVSNSHSISGNRLRFREGSTRIVLDQEWQNSMSNIRKLLFGVISSPLLQKYGYKI